VLVSEQNHRVFGSFTKLLELNRILVEFHPNNFSPARPLSFDPPDLRLDPMDARPSGQGVTLFECFAVVLCLRNCHAGSNRITAAQQGSEIRSVRDPQGRHNEVIAARNRVHAAIRILIATSVPATQRVRTHSQGQSDNEFMSIGLRRRP
jgi:hypothetical protein